MASDEHRSLVAEAFTSPTNIVPPHRLQNTDTLIRVYKRRWYILAVYTMLVAFSNILWNSWGPIQETCRLVFDWTDQTVLILGLISSVAYLLAGFPAAWIVAKQGLRCTTLFLAGIQVLSVALVILPSNNQMKTYLIYVFTGLIPWAVIIVQTVGILVVSVTWFPPHERTVATSIIYLVGTVGTALSYVFGPYIVPDIGSYQHGHKIDINKLRNETSPARMAYLRWKIEEYLYIEAGIAVFLFLCVALYFPAKPPSPPSVTAVTRRLDYVTGLKQLMRNKNLWIILLFYSISNGVQFGWVYVTDLILSAVGIDQETAGWIGFAGRIFVFPGIFFSWYADRFRLYTKAVMILLFLLSAVCTAVFSLACDQVIPLSKGLLFTMSLLEFMFFSGTIPLSFELAAECCYPVDEGIVSAVLGMAASIVNLVFFLTFSFVDVQPTRMNWVMTGAYACCIPLVFIYKDERKRLDIDTTRKEFLTT